MNAAGWVERRRTGTARMTVFCAALCLSSCGTKRGTATDAAASASAAPTPVSSAFRPPAPQPAPRKGMVWIPGGALVSGTPPDRLPRIADQEMPGEQVILKGFYVDLFPYPNEEGAIALTNVSQVEAAGLCAEQKKRLCTELEWERACKGPDNTTYEYGEAYRQDRCATGSVPVMRPSGVRVGCKSEWGVHDLHGGVWEWTASPWGRGSLDAKISIRGGNGVPGEVVGRCANAEGRTETTKSDTLGFRCCEGPRNEAEVTLKVVRGKKLELRDVDKRLGQNVLGLLPDAAKQDLQRPEKLKFDRMWYWRPIGNEELIVLAGCARFAKDPRCGVIVARVEQSRIDVVAWASSGLFFPAIKHHAQARDIWAYGGDRLGRYRRRVEYAWGRVNVGEPERPPVKRRQRNKRG